MGKMCHSCAAPLDNPDFRGVAADLCKYCSDETGQLREREKVKYGIAQWFMMWQPGIYMPKALARADIYMNSMPAWAEK
jgi:hypothetical protein